MINFKPFIFEKNTTVKIMKVILLFFLFLIVLISCTKKDNVDIVTTNDNNNLHHSSETFNYNNTNEVVAVLDDDIEANEKLDILKSIEKKLKRQKIHEQGLTTNDLLTAEEFLEMTLQEQIDYGITLLERYQKMDYKNSKDFYNHLKESGLFNELDSARRAWVEIYYFQETMANIDCKTNLKEYTNTINNMLKIIENMDPNLRITKAISYRLCAVEYSAIPDTNNFEKIFQKSFELESNYGSKVVYLIHGLDIISDNVFMETAFDIAKTIEIKKDMDDRHTTYDEYLKVINHKSSKNKHKNKKIPELSDGVISSLSERIESENENNVIEGINQILKYASAKGTNIYINLLESRISLSEGAQKEKYIKTLETLRNN